MCAPQHALLHPLERSNNHARMFNRTCSFNRICRVFIEKNKYTVDWWRHVNNHWELVKKEVSIGLAYYDSTASPPRTPHHRDHCQVSVEDRDIGNKIHAPTEWHDIPEHVMVFFNSPGLSP